jgi:hypothetical protein
LSAAHLREVESLIHICRGACEEVQSGRLTDLEAFDARFDGVFERLCELGEVTGTPAEQSAVRRRLKDLEKVRLQLANELNELRKQMADRLIGVSRGRKGLSAYRHTLGRSGRGALRGQG